MKTPISQKHMMSNETGDLNRRCRQFSVVE